MNWTLHHDIILCREILFIYPFKVKERTLERGQLSKTIAEILKGITSPKFNVDQRGVREHLALLKKKYKKKMADEEKSSGTSPARIQSLTKLSEIL